MMKKYIVILFLLFFASCSSHNNVVDEHQVDEYQVVYDQQLDGIQDINDTGIYVKTEGHGEPLIMVHGGPGLDHSYLQPHFDGLLDHHRLIYFDQRGAGRSSADLDEESMTFYNMVADIDAIRKELGYETVSVLGHSFGTLLAMQFALDYPDRVNKLILVNPVGGSTEYMDGYQQILEVRATDEDQQERKEILESDAMKENKPEAYQRLFYNTFKAHFYDRSKLNDLNLWFPQDMAGRQQLLKHLAVEMGSFNLYDRLSELQKPVLIAHGDFDVIPVYEAKILHGHLPDSELTVYENTGHFAFIEAREQLINDIREFLQQ